MEILKKGKDYIDIRVDLKQPLCPYCKAEVYPEYKWKTCRCKVIDYRKEKEREDTCQEKCCLPLEDSKIVELYCYPTNEYLCFKIREKVSERYYLYVDYEATSEDLKNFLNLSESTIMNYIVGGKSGKRKVALYTGNLNFWQRIMLLKLKNMRMLSKLFNSYLKEVKDGKAK